MISPISNDDLPDNRCVLVLDHLSMSNSRCARRTCANFEALSFAHIYKFTQLITKIQGQRHNVFRGALKTQVQHFVGENVAWEKVTTN